MNDLLQSAESFIVFGAKFNAVDAAVRLCTLYPGKLLGFSVTKMGGNPPCLMGYPVRPVHEWCGDRSVNMSTTCVVVALREKFYREVGELLRSYDIMRFVTWNEISRSDSVNDEHLMRIASDDNRTIHRLTRQFLERCRTENCI